MLRNAIALAGQGRLSEAVAIITGLAAAGDPGALFTLGDMHWRGIGVPQDHSRGRDIFGRAARAGHPMAMRGYTNLLASGSAGPRDWQGALKRLREEARSDGLRARMLSLIEKMDLTTEGEPRRTPEGRKVSHSPNVTLFPLAFSKEECDFLIAIAEPSYEPSRLADQSREGARTLVRTSDEAPIHWLIEDPATHALNRRLAAISGTAVEQGEPLLILRYRPGQEFRPHCDWLDVSNKRVLTALVYLNEGYEGGETQFVKTGLKLKGRTGDVLLFHNATPDGERDPMSLHAGLPVVHGTKYLASRWIREHRHIQ